MERIKQVTQEAYDIGYEEGWDEFECCHGYSIFDGEYPTNFGMIDGLHIERIDLMGVWDSDITAAQHAEKHEGIKIIRDIPNLYKVFIDTPENRANIMKQIKEAKMTKTFRVVVSVTEHYEVYVNAEDEEDAEEIALENYYDGTPFDDLISSIVSIEEEE